ncbi:hypothetical protein [Deinococcus sp. PESE-13]
MRRFKRWALGAVLVCFSVSSGLAGGAPGTPCTQLHLPATWDVRAVAYADVTGDGTPECVLSVWRPWKDWPIARWSASATPITPNHDAGGDSSHVAVLKPLPSGTYRNIWVGSALYRPVTRLAVQPGGTLVTWETTYAQGREGRPVAVSSWRWTGFGFGLVERRPLSAGQ